MRVSELTAMIEALKESAKEVPTGAKYTILEDIKKDSFIFVCNSMLNLLSKVKECNI